MFARSSRDCSACLVAAISLVASASVSHAQTRQLPPQQAQAGAGEQEGTGEEIVVTARKREERLQDVPVAVTYLGQEDLRERDIIKPYDLQFSTPGLQVRAGSSANNPQYFIRGQGSSFSTAPGVLPYFAEAPLSSTDNFAMYDLENVQVLKGPQGTLFGRSTPGGAILLTPAKPTNTWGGYLDLKAGDYRMREVEAAVNLPLIPDKFELRVAGNFVRRRGYDTNLLNGADLDNRHRDSLRIGATIGPFSGFKTYTLFQLIDINEHGSAPALVAFNPGLNVFDTSSTGIGFRTIAAICGSLNRGNAAGNASCIATRVQLLDELVANLASEAARLRTGGNEAVRFSQSFNTPVTITRTEEIHNITTYELGTLPGAGDITLKNVFSTTRTLRNFFQYNFCDSAYQHCDNNNGGQAIKNGAQVIDPSLAANNWLGHYTEEVQVLGTGKGWNWILGSFLQHDSTPPASSGTIFYTFRNVFSPSLSNALSATNIPVSSTSKYTNVFGQVVLDLGLLTPFLDNLRFTAGYARSQLDSSSITAVPAYTATSTAIPGPLNPPVSLHQGAPSYTFGFDYQVNAGLLAYIVTRQGFKQGGTNPLVVNTIPGQVATFGPEINKDLETGLKYSYHFGDIGGHSNIAIYNDWYTQIQRNQILTNPNPPFNAQAQTNNIGSARIYGLEWENEARFRHWLFNLNYAYIDAKYTQYAGSEINILGQAVPLITSAYPDTPRNQLTVGAHYDIVDEPDIGIIRLGGDYYRQSSVELDDDPTKDPANPGLQRGYGLLNLRLDWNGIAGHGVDFAVYVTNVTNTTFMLGVHSFIGNLGVMSANYNEPRMFGVEFRYRQ